MQAEQMLLDGHQQYRIVYPIDRRVFHQLAQLISYPSQLNLFMDLQDKTFDFTFSKLQIRNPIVPLGYVGVEAKAYETVGNTFRVYDIICLIKFK